MRKLFLLVMAAVRVARLFRGGRARHGRHDVLARQAGRLLRALLRGRR